LEYGRSHEKTAVEAYKKSHSNIRVQECGLFISLATPDRLLNIDGVLEVKCPRSALGYPTLEETSKHHNIGIKVCKKKGSLCLQPTHRYYYQIQGQLHATKRDYCDFFVWSPKDTFLQRITRDGSFWQRCVEQLRPFYFGYLLPEILDWRVARNMPLRSEPVTSEIEEF
ncbi:unnamed protein product, partial [Ixodes persulcatus]